MSLPASFVGEAKPLDGYDIPKLAHRANVGEDHFRAFFEVEAGGRAFDSKGRPVMLYEPHVFYRNLPAGKREAAVAAGLAYPKWRPGAYPKDSYPRLLEAIKIDRDAALKACSIGLSQILVENHAQIGYETPEAMWQAFMDDEEEHVEAMLRFILANNIDDDLRAERWSTVARVYNGPRYAENGYDKKMAAAFARWKAKADTAWAPDKPDPTKLTISDKATLTSVQKRLAEIGYPEVGKADGVWGSKMRAAVLGFRADNGLPIVADVDKDLLSALMIAGTRPISPERAATTASDLAKAGSRKIKAADHAEAAGAITALGGAGAALASVSDSVESLKGLTVQFSGLIDTVKGMSPWVLLAVGAYVVYQQYLVKKATVEDYRTGRYVGR